jgi:hypothetical protein
MSASGGVIILCIIASTINAVGYDSIIHDAIAIKASLNCQCPRKIRASGSGLGEGCR